MITRAQAAARFEAEEQLNAESLDLELAIKDAGGWDAYVALRDGQNRIPEKRKTA